MPIIKGFKATNVWNAFILNSIATSLGVVIAVILQNFFKPKIYSNFGQTMQTLVTFAMTFGGMMFAYTLLHALFGFGYGLVIPGSENVPRTD